MSDRMFVFSIDLTRLLGGGGHRSNKRRGEFDEDSSVLLIFQNDNIQRYRYSPTGLWL